MTPSHLNFDAVVLGGGSAGWLTALFLQRNWPKLKIVVVEDPKRPPIIAGESGTTTFVSLMRSLKIDMEDFIKQVNATPKLGGKFTDWNGVGTEFIHCLQTDHAPWLDGWSDYVDSELSKEDLKLGSLINIMTTERHKDSYLRTLIANEIPLADAFLATAYIKENKVPFGSTPADIPCTPMWHFESRSAAAYFKKIAFSRGIEHIEGEYLSSVQRSDGNIESIKLDYDRDVSSKWFFDCSGFARLLLGKVLKEEFIDYTDYFPARAVVAWWDEPCYCPTTNATAMKYGWSWNINLRHRSGNGYIYDPDHINLEQAINEAEVRFNKKIDPIANFQFTPGIMKRAWSKNVIGIGLSTGFLEPLEANGVAVIVESLYALQDHWKPFTHNEPRTIDHFNGRVFAITEDIRDFLALHYRGQRRDTDFWKSHAYDSKRIPPSLVAILENWRNFFVNNGPEPFVHGYSPTAWLMVVQALKLFPTSNLAEIHAKKLQLGKTVLEINQNKYKTIVSPFWTIEQWIKNTA
jgi:tryptophan halogenase